MHRDFGKMENLTAGKGWAVGYEPCQMAIRRRAARHFDIRNIKPGRQARREGDVLLRRIMHSDQLGLHGYTRKGGVK